MSGAPRSVQATTSPRLRTAKLLALVAVLITVIGAIRTFPVDQYLLGLVEWIQGAGLMGATVYILVYVLATVLFLPGSILTLGAGFAYGVVKGTAVVWVGANVGAALAFVLGRTLARDWIATKVTSSERFAAIDRAVASVQQS